MTQRGGLPLAVCSLLLVASPDRLRVESASVRISSVDVMLSPAGPVVLLKAKSRAIPIFVDPVVAESINAALGGKPPPRPLTHDLMRTVLESFDAKITSASITLKGAVFYADLRISVNGKEKTFDSRSSDAIALALRFHAPIFVSEELFESAGKPLPDADQQEL